ncbi:hypothetical protein [Candidatus Ichthyocystis sparus]|nr:hypothetical protein [Candidatus Ichthyocystis sparus]
MKSKLSNTSNAESGLCGKDEQSGVGKQSQSSDSLELEQGTGYF